MTRQRQQYWTSDYKNTFVDFRRAPEVRYEQLIDVSPRIEKGARSMRSSMLRKATVVLAIVLVLGNFGLSTSALARGGGHGDNDRGDSFRGNYLRGGFRGIPGDSFGGYGNRTGGLRENRDVWGHWGTYYGPMIPAI
jgi:hypothetical protein